jgi:drug/metabolite transporter (DMT)-like permease
VIPPRPVASRWIGLLCLLVTSAGWGINWTAMKFLLREWPPLFARGVAGIAAALILVIVGVVLHESFRVPRPLWPRLATSGLLNVFAWMGFATLCLRWLTASEGAMLVYTMPVWATLLAWPILGRRPSLRAVAGLVLCIAGIAMLFGASGVAFDVAKLPGVIFALLSAVLFALGTVALRRLPLDPFAQVAWQLVIGCLPMLVFGMLFEEPRWSALTPTGAWIIAYMTVIPMGVCYLTWFAAVRLLPPTTASMATLLTPAIGVVSAALVLGEPLGIRQLLALLLVVGGVALALRTQ